MVHGLVQVLVLVLAQLTLLSRCARIARLAPQATFGSPESLQPPSAPKSEALFSVTYKSPQLTLLWVSFPQ